MASQLNWNRLRKWLIVAFASGILLAGTVTWFAGGALIAPANRTVGPPPENYPAQSCEIRSSSGAKIAAWYAPIANSHATVILLHPIRGDRRSMLSRAHLLRERGYSTLLIDLQAHGESSGENITVGYRERHDVIAAIDFVRTQNPGQKIGIIDRSLGRAATLLATPDIDALVIESVYPTVSEAVHNRVAIDWELSITLSLHFC